MDNLEILKKFQTVYSVWENELDGYDFDTLLVKPNEESWSMGQLYNHLITSTLGFHLKQVHTCLASNNNKEKKKNFKGIITYKVLGKLPPVKVKVPPSDAYTPKQPKDLQELKDGMNLVAKKMQEMLSLLDDKGIKHGKTAHPAIGFLNANEWFRLVEMHFTHHLRQKKSLDLFIAKK